MSSEVWLLKSEEEKLMDWRFILFVPGLLFISRFILLSIFCFDFGFTFECGSWLWTMCLCLLVCRKRQVRRRMLRWGASKSWKRNWKRETPTSTTSGGLRPPRLQTPKSSQPRPTHAASTTSLRWTTRPKTGPTTAPSANMSLAGANIASSATTTSKSSRLCWHQPRRLDGDSLMTMSLEVTIALAFAVVLSMTVVTCEEWWWQTRQGGKNKMGKQTTGLTDRMIHLFCKHIAYCT